MNEVTIAKSPNAITNSIKVTPFFFLFKIIIPLPYNLFF